MSTPDLANRYTRQQDLVPAGRLSQLTVTVVGVGAIGRQVALQLAAIGAPRLELIDPDVVGVENLAPQGYLEADLGSLKVTATANACRRLNSSAAIEERPERFRRSQAVGDVLFCCVDSIATRRVIWEACKDRLAFYCDTRMSSEVLRVLVTADRAGKSHYPTTLFAAGEAHAGSCTSKSTIYTANIAAGLAVAQFTRWLRGLPLDADLAFNILTSELTCS